MATASQEYDLETLSELLSDIEPAIAASLSALDRITSWAAVARYPDGEASPSVAEVRTASKEVRQFVATCEQAALSPKK